MANINGWGRGTWGQLTWGEPLPVVITGVAGTTAYVTTNEATGTNYTAGGSALTNVNPSSSGTTGFTDFADLTFGTATITARGCMIYNDTNADRAVAVFDFGGDKTSTAGSFTISFPTADASNAVIRIA